MCLGYFASTPSKGALVQHPTGTGKTGIMAVTGCLRAVEGPVLIICPSAALADQLTREVGSEFWRKVKAPTEWKPEMVFQLLPKDIGAAADRITSRAPAERVVVITTVQALQQIHATPTRYARLVGLFASVLFDEGHREPAPAWARAVRGLKAPTILFSATPFRNDIKLFDIDLDHVAFLSFHDAVDRHLIRNVTIDPTPLPSSLQGFAGAVIARRDQAIADGSLPPNAKVIVRANSADGVRDLFDAFKAKLGNRHDGILGVHNRFKLEGDTGAQLRPDVPNDLAARPERFLIHQFMLTEGIDDPSCTMLALFEPFSTERQLVQQFGRLTRHPTPGTVQAPALVVTTMPDEVARMWGGFLSFDRICMENGGKPPLHAGKEVLEKLVEALPAVDYVDGRFRTRVELDGDFTDELRVPRSALVFELGDGFDMDAFQGEIEERLYEMDRIEAGNGGIDDGACRFHLSLALTQSRFLAETLFLSPSLEATIYSKSGSHLYFYDSGGLFLDEVKGLKRRASAAQMRSLLAEGADNRITQLHLKNTDLGPAALRSRSQTARSLARAGVFMGEHLNVVTRATGLVDGTRRAVAFTSSRVREGEGAQASPADFHTWAAQVDTELHAAKPAADLFGRFALPIAAPPITVPANILIDIDDVSEGVRDAAGAPVEFDTNDVCQDIVPDPTGPEDFKFRFSLKINGKSNPVWIKWDKLKQKYWLRSEELSKFKIVGSPRTSLTNRLNQRQPFRILPQNLDAIYAFGQFYSIDLKLAAAGGTGALVLDLLTDVAGLTARTTEKGNLRAPATHWPADSVFDYIDRALTPGAPTTPLGPTFPLLICDDIGQEAADFICVDKGSGSNQPRIVLIAAKGKKPAKGDTGVSASDLYDVCGQVAKNLAYLKADTQALPGSLEKWDKDWKLNGGEVPRMRQGTTAQAFRTAFTAARANPAATREMWMILGGAILSKKAAKREFARATPKAHVLQFHHLLLSTYSTCQSVGVNLRIFCVP
ncbi:MAG: RNA helicase [Erythrobacter sp.]|nr:RNA helicase [Erythrobacter sp.]